MFLAGVSLAASAFAGTKDNYLEPMEPAEVPAEATPAPSATPASSPTAATTAPVKYAGEIRRYPDADNAAPVKGYLSLAISPLGKVSGIVTWYDTHQQVKVSGKQDLTTHHGSFIIRDADGNRVPGAVRLPFRISQKGQLVGGGITEGGETTSFRVPRNFDDSSYGYGSAGGATLSLGGSVSISSGAATFINTSTASLAGINSNLGLATGTAGLTFTDGSIVTSTGTSTLTSSGTFNGGLVALGTTASGTLAINVSSGASAPAINAAGNLVLGNTVILLGPVTSATAADGTVTYTGQAPSGGATTVIVHFS